MEAAPVESAAPGGSRIVLGRPSATREEWEAAREADAADLNRVLEKGGDVEAYVVPLWSQADAARCLQELQGFGDVRVYVEIPEAGREDTLALLPETEIGAAHRGESLPTLAHLVHAAASLDIPLYLTAPNALKALAFAISEDLTPREIEQALSGNWPGEPDAGALDHARELMPEFDE